MFTHCRPFSSSTLKKFKTCVRGRAVNPLRGRTLNLQSQTIADTRHITLLNARGEQTLTHFCVQHLLSERLRLSDSKCCENATVGINGLTTGHQTRKTTPITRVAVQETTVSRHNGGPLKSLNTIVLRCTEGFRGVPMITRDATGLPATSHFKKRDSGIIFTKKKGL